MNRLLLGPLLFLLLMGLASAGTVTLTGTCGKYQQSNRTVNFTLTNSGNDTAGQLVITPLIQNAELANSSSTISALGPDSTAILNFSITGIKERGTSIAFFSVAYQQSTSIFTAVFPCLIALGSATTSQIILGENTTITGKGNATVKLRVINAALTQIDANVSLILPLAFTYLSSKYIPLSLAPGQSANVTFLLGFPQGGASSYSAAATARYSQGNLSHASLVSFVINTAPPASISLGSLVIYFIALVLFIVVLLIALSLVRRRKKANNDIPQV